MGKREEWGIGTWDGFQEVACASLVLAKSGGLSVVTLRRLFYPWVTVEWRYNQYCMVF
jgi:hypothetical protein